MSDYGLKIYNASANTILDTTDVITRFRYSTVASSDVTGSIMLPDIVNASSVELSVSLETFPTSYSKAQHLVDRTGSKLKWTNRNATYYSSADSLIFSFLYT